MRSIPTFWCGKICCKLFGFTSLVEKEWHRLLMTVQGVGAKASMSILSALGPEGVSRAVALGDWSALAKAKGVGPKTAQRVIMELKDKAPTVMAMSGADLVPEVVTDEGVQLAPVAPSPKRTAAGRGIAQAEALSALSNLGYGPGEAAGAVAQAIEQAPVPRRRI